MVAIDNPGESVDPAEPLYIGRCIKEKFSSDRFQNERELPPLLDLLLLLSRQRLHIHMQDLIVVKKLVLRLRVIGMEDPHTPLP